MNKKFKFFVGLLLLTNIVHAAFKEKQPIGNHNKRHTQSTFVGSHRSKKKTSWRFGSICKDEEIPLGSSGHQQSSGPQFKIDNVTVTPGKTEKVTLNVINDSDQDLFIRARYKADSVTAHRYAPIRKRTLLRVPENPEVFRMPAKSKFTIHQDQMRSGKITIRIWPLWYNPEKDLNDKGAPLQTSQENKEKSLTFSYKGSGFGIQEAFQIILGNPPEKDACKNLNKGWPHKVNSWKGELSENPSFENEFQNLEIYTLPKENYPKKSSLKEK